MKCTIADSSALPRMLAPWTSQNQQIHVLSWVSTTNHYGGHAQARWALRGKGLLETARQHNVTPPKQVCSKTA